MRIRIILATLALVCAACATSRSPVSAEICEDPRIVEQMKIRELRFAPGKSDCKSFTMPYRENKKIVDVQVARVLSGWFSGGDVMEQRWEDFVLLPSDELVSLGWFPALEFNYPNARAYTHRATKLGEECPEGQCLTQLFNPVLEKRIRRLCITYEMKLPYTGSFGECADNEIIPGDIEMAKDAIPWQEAKGIACAQLLTETGLKCVGDAYSPIQTKLGNDPDGTLAYFVEFRFAPHEKSKCQKLRYRVGPMDGKATLIEKSWCEA